MSLSGGCGHSPFVSHHFLLPLPGRETRSLYGLKAVSGILCLLGKRWWQEWGPLVSDTEDSTITFHGSGNFLNVGRG